MITISTNFNLKSLKKVLITIVIEKMFQKIELFLII